MSPDTEELRAAVVGALFGGITLGVVIQFTTPMMPAMGRVYMVDQPSLVGGWVALLFLSVILGILFAAIVTRYIDDYIATVLSLTTRSEAAKNMVMPLTNRFGMALVVTTAMGLVYGLVVGFGLGAVIVPMLAPVVVVPYLDGSLLVGFVLFGVILGGTYGELVMG
jgi:large-conductance mechanosensitive channel